MATAEPAQAGSGRRACQDGCIMDAFERTGAVGPRASRTPLPPTHRADVPARPSAADRVYEHVRAGILSRRYPDHALLIEGVLAQETGVSRTPVREALLRLQSEHMVALLPKRGALVLPVTAQEAADVLDTRRLVERHCTRTALLAGRGPEVAEAARLHLEALREACRVGDPARYAAADREFHATIVAAADNDILVRLYASLRDRQLRMGVVNLLDRDARPDLPRMQATVDQHADILAALAREDLDEADRLTAAHLDSAARTLVGRSADPAVAVAPRSSLDRPTAGSTVAARPRSSLARPTAPDHPDRAAPPLMSLTALPGRPL
jgi:DNA-binding GntR family transcriptional regulator